MLTVLAFVGLLALEALVFSKIEGWSFFDGVCTCRVLCSRTWLPPFLDADFPPTQRLQSGHRLHQ